MKTCLIAVLACATVLLTGGDLWARAAQQRGNIFARIDTNRDGVISPTELQAAFLARGQQAFKRADKNNDGLLTREEARAIPMFARQGIEKALNALDRNKDGSLSWRELRPAYVRLGQRLFRRADKNNDSSLQQEEFKAITGHFGQRKQSAN